MVLHRFRGYGAEKGRGRGEGDVLPTPKGRKGAMSMGLAAPVNWWIVGHFHIAAAGTRRREIAMAGQAATLRNFGNAPVHHLRDGFR